MGLSSVLPFLAALRKQVPDAGGFVGNNNVPGSQDTGAEAAWTPDMGSDWGNAPGPTPIPPAGPIAQQPVSQLPNVGSGEPPAAPEDKGNMFRQPYESKGHALLRILQSGLVGGLSGLSQNAATYAQTGRNAGFGGGVGAGYAQTLPFLQASQQMNLAQQGANIQDIQSQTALRKAQAGMMGQSIPITLPNGQQVFVPASQAGRPLAAAISGGYGITKAQMDNQTKTAIAELQSGRLGHLVAGINPDTNQPGMQMLDKQGNSIGWIDHSVVPSLMARTSSTVEYREDAQGNLHVLPKTTVSRPNLPAQGAAPGQPATGTQPSQAQPQRSQAAPSPTLPFLPAAPKAATPAAPATPGGGRVVPGFQGKASADMGVAFNPQANERQWMTRAEANTNGFQDSFAPGGRNAAKTMGDDRTLNVRLGDIEQKLAQYDETMKTPLSLKDTADLNTALAATEKALVTPGLMSKLPGPEGAANVLNEVAKNYNLNDMSAGTYKRLQAYVNMREAMLGYTAALTNSGRSSDKNLELNLAVVPPPVMEPSKAAEGLAQFRQNLDVVEQGVPRVKGVKAPKEWRGGQQGQGGPPSGARVRDYTALQPGQPQTQPTPAPR